jgi:hypothetical protein
MRYGRNRYRSIYTSKRRRRGSGAAKIVTGVIVAAALVFLGYSIQGPLVALLTGKLTQSTSSSASGSSQVSKATSAAVSDTSSAAAGDTSSAAQTTAAAQIRGVYLPKSYLSDTAALNTFITQAKAAGINLAVIDLKAEDGIVNYDTSVEQAKGTAIVAKNAPDASAAAKALLSAGITPAARICAFKDPVAPTVMRGAGVMYSGNHSINWLDPTNTRWLNPYSTAAQEYIEDLAVEAVSLGYQQVFIDSLTFPTVGSPDSSGYYGDNMPSKEEVISGFVTALKQKVNTAGGKLTVMASGAAAIGQATANVGQSQNIFSLSGDYISPNLCPSLFTKSGIQVGTATITKPDLTPGDTVNTVAQYLKAQNSDKISAALPFIQAYTNQTLGEGYYKEYTAADIKEEIAALTSAGINGYVLYNPSGTYDLSSLK